MISCRQASRMLSEAMEHRLPPMARLSLRLHLVICSMCRAYAGDLRILRAALARLRYRALGPAPGLTEDERRQMLSRIKAAIDAAERPS